MLAIVIPYYKKIYFDETLKSLANQSHKQFKVYIGDDASPENPNIVMEKYKGKFDFIYHRFNKNLGRISLTEHWKRCVCLSANEEWVMILGDDDVLENKVVEEFYKALDNLKNKINVIRFSTIKIDGRNKAISNIYINPIFEISTSLLFRETRSSLSEYVFRKENILRVGFKNFPLAWHSDMLAVLEVSNFDQIYSINEAVVQIRISNESISGSTQNMNKKIRATFKFYYYLLSRKGEYFTIDQKKVLLLKLKNSYLHRKKSAINFLKISSIYIKFFDIKEYIGFLKLFWVKIMKNESR